MGLRRLGAQGGLPLLAFVLAAACSGGSQDGTADDPSGQPPSGGSSQGANADATVGFDSNSSGDSSGNSSGDSTSSSGDRGSAFSSDDAAPTSSPPDAAPACAKGQVTPNQVVMLGDSYLDPAWGNVGPTIMTDANAMYRHYYIGAASMAWGNPNTQFFIPYQYDPMALMDPSVMSSADIKVVILDGGGNDVLIGNTSCETTAPPSNTSCVMTIQNAINEVTMETQKMATNGVKWVVYFFYPHLSTAGGGILQTPAPAVNDTLDYAYPLAEKFCCGSSFTSSLTNYSCTGQPAAGLNCVFIDTRPAFEGHLADYIGVRDQRIRCPVNVENGKPLERALTLSKAAPLPCRVHARYPSGPVRRRR
jgi:hypothetical protein